MNKPLEANDHEDPEVSRIDAVVNDIDQETFDELHRHADIERKKLKAPLPRIDEELKESESSDDQQVSFELYTDAVVEEQHHDDPLEEIKVEDDGVELAVNELEQYDDIDALRQPPAFDD